MEDMKDTTTMEITKDPQTPKDNSVAFKDVSFTYDGANIPALDHVTFRVEPGQTAALQRGQGATEPVRPAFRPRAGAFGFRGEGRQMRERKRQCGHRLDFH